MPTRPTPTTPYGAAKRAAELLAQRTVAASTLEVICLRPPGVCDDATMAAIRSLRAERASFEWDPIWEYSAWIHADDVARALVAACVCPAPSRPLRLSADRRRCRRQLRRTHGSRTCRPHPPGGPVARKHRLRHRPASIPDRRDFRPSTSSDGLHECPGTAAHDSIPRSTRPAFRGSRQDQGSPTPHRARPGRPWSSSPPSSRSTRSRAASSFRRSWSSLVRGRRFGASTELMALVFFISGFLQAGSLVALGQPSWENTEPVKGDIEAVVRPTWSPCARPRGSGDRSTEGPCPPRTGRRAPPPVSSSPPTDTADRYGTTFEIDDRTAVVCSVPPQR